MNSRPSEDSGTLDRYPRVFGGYLLLQLLGRGGMGRVELAKTSAIAGIDMHHVIKTVRPDVSDRESIARFLDEARVAVHLTHRNICTVTDVGRVGDEHFLAMEFIPGRTVLQLTTRLHELGRKLPERLALHICGEMLDALEYAHQLKSPITGEPLSIIHRDVSPQNAMVSFDGEVKLIDFGLASSRLKRERTEKGVVFGRLVYMSPEQARGGEIDATVDQRAAAVVAYEMLTGAAFFEGMSVQEVWNSVGGGDYVAPRLGELDPQVAAVLRRAFAVQPSDRYPSCAAMGDALDRVREQSSLRSTGRELRELMQEIFEEDIRETQRMLSQFGNVAVVAPKSSPDVTRVVSQDHVIPTELAVVGDTQLQVPARAPVDAQGKAEPTRVALPDRS